MSKVCLVCGASTNAPIRHAFTHFRIYQPGAWQYLRGNMAMGGSVRGFLSTCYLAFPWLNTIVFWKHRKSTLQLDVGGMPVPLETFFDENGCAKKDQP